MADTDRDRQAEYDRLLFRRKSLSGSEFAGIGMQFAGMIVVSALAGIWLDRRLGTSPWLLLVMVFGGAGLGTWTMYRKAMRSFGKDSESRGGPGPGSGRL